MKLVNKSLKKRISWISSHPITGSEVSGPEHGNQNLFENKWCVLIKEKNKSLKHIKFLSKFWRAVGSKVIIMNAEKHDKIFSITSHLPHLIAYNMLQSAQEIMT